MITKYQFLIAFKYFLAEKNQITVTSGVLSADQRNMSTIRILI